MMFGLFSGKRKAEAAMADWLAHPNELGVSPLRVTWRRTARAQPTCWPQNEGSFAGLRNAGWKRRDSALWGRLCGHSASLIFSWPTRPMFSERILDSWPSSSVGKVATWQRISNRTKNKNRHLSLHWGPRAIPEIRVQERYRFGKLEFYEFAAILED